MENIMQKEEIIKIINDFLIDEFEVEEDLLLPDAGLKKDLGIDSLDFVDIAVIIENKFDIRIKGEEMGEVRTLGDFHNYILSKLNVSL